MSQKCPLQKIMKKQGLWADAKKLLREKQKMLHNLKMWRLKCQIHVKTCSATEMPKNIQ